MQTANRILSCDWGTSSFRLRLIDIETRQSIAEVTSDNGNASIFNKWKAQPDTNRLRFYLVYLQEGVDALAQKADTRLNDVPILVSGMASSTIGMKELAYGNIPFAIDGHTAKAEWIDAKPVLPNDVLLISGVQSENDVMRGEEVQLVGVMSQVDLKKDIGALFLFPGTHSKHIRVEKGEIVDFKTFMTGEMFELVAKHSILAHAVTSTTGEQDIESFRKGVEKALDTDLLNSLFSVRINQLKNRMTTEQNYFYLSGLLIGAEVKYIQSDDNTQVVLCSSGKFLKLYENALDYLRLSRKVVVIESNILDAAAAAGQIEIFKNFRNKS